MLKKVCDDCKKFPKLGIEGNLENEAIYIGKPIPKNAKIIFVDRSNLKRFNEDIHIGNLTPKNKTMY